MGFCTGRHQGGDSVQISAVSKEWQEQLFPPKGRGETPESKTSRSVSEKHYPHDMLRLGALLQDGEIPEVVNKLVRDPVSCIPC